MSREGGKCRLVGDVAADDAQGAGEGDPVGVAVRLVCGVVHQVPQGVVDQEECRRSPARPRPGAGSAGPGGGRPGGS